MYRNGQVTIRIAFSAGKLRDDGALTGIFETNVVVLARRKANIIALERRDGVHYNSVGWDGVYGNGAGVSERTQRVNEAFK